MKYLKITITLLLLLSCLNVFSQKKLKFAERLIYGSSLTYILHNDENFREIKFHEFTWNNNIAVNITPALYFGIGYMFVHTRGSMVFPNSPNKENYNLTSAFLQYDFIPNEKMRIFPEVSWSYGNYCFCGIEDPEKIEGLHYLGLGAGLDYPITDRLSIDVAMMFYNIVSDIDIRKGDYNIYTLGLNFDIINQKK
jgi:hypothetical protein